MSPELFVREPKSYRELLAAMLARDSTRRPALSEAQHRFVLPTSRPTEPP